MLKRITTPSIDKNKKNKKMMTKGTIQEVKQQPFYSRTIPKRKQPARKRGEFLNYLDYKQIKINIKKKKN